MGVRDKLIAAIWLFLLAATLGAAQSTSNATSTEAVPRLVKFGGIVRDDVGHAKTGVVGVTFAIYKDQEGGAPLWLETQNVETDNKGNYTALLGSTKVEGLPAELFTSNEARWLGVQIEGQAEQQRVLFVSVPYALKAGDAETIGGLPPSAFVRANPTGGTAAGANKSTSASISSAASGAISSTASKTPPPAVLTVNTPSPGATATFVPLWIGTSPTHTLGSSALFQLGSSQLGLNTKTPGASLEIDSNNQLGLFVNAPFSGVGAGLDFHTTGTGGKGWEILATGRTAAQGPSKLNIRDLSTGADVFTIAPGGRVGVGTVNPGAALDVEESSNGIGGIFGRGVAFGVKGENALVGGVGVWGEADATTGTNNGVFGEIFSSTSNATAVLGIANATSGTTYGVRGINSSSGQFAAGVEGENFSTTGVTFGLVGSTSSPNGIGAIALADGESSTGSGLIGCCPAGVWGDVASNAGGATALAGTADDARAIFLANNSPSGVPTAFMFQGAAGQLALQAGGSGFCTVDTTGHLHCDNGVSTLAPVDTGQRRVALYAVQSPQNWFEDFGSGRLASGATTVTLDRTFAETVNTVSDYHVFLTPVGDCRGLYVSQKAATGFEVRELGGGQSNASFDYRIVALRRGFENVRLADMTERWKKMNAPLPKAAPGPRLTLPTRPPARAVPAKSNIAAANLNLQR